MPAGCGLWAGSQEAKRWRHALQAQRAERLERRKEEKRARKARGARAASEASSVSDVSESLSDTGSEASLAAPSESDATSDSSVATPSDSDANDSGGDGGRSSGDTNLPKGLLALRRAARAPRATSTDTRIRNADLYVVRLLQDTDSKAKAKEQRRRVQRSASAPPPVQTAMPRYADSRPCWRCLEWMHWAGIKRVFWTDAQGTWHGGKVNELLCSAPDGNPVLVHLTQYEHAAALLRGRMQRDALPVPG